MNFKKTLDEIINIKPTKESKIVFVSGNFNIIHPGHLRLLNFAKSCGDILIVGVNRDMNGNTHIPQKYRLEGIQAVSVVDYAFSLDAPPEEFIDKLKPNIVVKGKEYENALNRELETVEAYGGRLLFSSGDVQFSSLDLLQKEYFETNYNTIVKPDDYPERHGFRVKQLVDIINTFSQKKVIVIGDLIVDEYINCAPLGMSQEDPTIVVSPINKNRFIGGAGIVAAHAKSLGADVHFFSVCGVDEAAEYAKQSLKSLGVCCEIFSDDSRPTTLKQRFKAESKTLLRVSHLRQHDISKKIITQLVENIKNKIAEADLLIFSDFNYGALPQQLVNDVCEYAEKFGLLKIADSQSSSQLGDISRFHNMDLITPTEHEARMSIRDSNSGLVVLADNLKDKAKAKQVVLTLGKEGLLINAPLDNEKKYITDKLPAFNTAARDVSGAGDSFMVSTALAMASGADIWKSVYIGSIAAACQVSREGNMPLTSHEIITELMI